MHLNKFIFVRQFPFSFFLLKKGKNKNNIFLLTYNYHLNSDYETYSQFSKCDLMLKLLQAQTSIWSLGYTWVTFSYEANFHVLMGKHILCISDDMLLLVLCL